MSTAGVTFAAVGVGLLIAHQVADHWVQTSHQAGQKGLPGWPGRKACAAHVATYTMVTGAVVGLLWGALDLRISPVGFLVGQVVSAGTHYWADRRFTLARLCERTGRGGFYRLGQDSGALGTGAYALDQSWHWAWLGVAAFLTAVIS